MPKTKAKDQKDPEPEDSTLAARVEVLEKEVAALKKMLDNGAGRSKPGPDDWMKSFGRFKDDPTYDEALRLGRAWRRRQPKC